MQKDAPVKNISNACFIQIIMYSQLNRNTKKIISLKIFLIKLTTNTKKAFTFAWVFY
jgi:hypothetical protein